jgi:hypothetical protein
VSIAKIERDLSSIADDGSAIRARRVRAVLYDDMELIGSDVGIDGKGNVIVSMDAATVDQFVRWANEHTDVELVVMTELDNIVRWLK